MINKDLLAETVAAYKKHFPNHWKDEQYKWEAVKWFQQHWNINAESFADMLEVSLSKTYNLLASVNNFPARMLVEFAKAYQEDVRAMFLDLFDETEDVYERIKSFKNKADDLLVKYFGNEPKQHYQGENAISTYLWLRYPDKYYIYKFGEVKTVASVVESDYRFKKGAYAENIRNALKLYDEISAALKEDDELINLLKSALSDTCYPDPELKTLTIDVGFYISRYYLTDTNGKGNDEITEEIDTDTLQSNARYTKWLAPVIEALRVLGGSASRSSVQETVISMCNVSAEEQEKKYSSGLSVIANHLDWAMLALSAEGFLEGPRGIWTLTDLGKRIIITDILAEKIVAKQNKIALAKKQGKPVPVIDLTPYYTFIDEDWYPSETEYNPGLSKEDWLEILKNPEIIGPVWGGVLAAFFSERGAATCSQIAKKFNRTPSSIAGNCTQLSKRIATETKCNLMKNKDSNPKYWPILFVGKNANADEDGVWVWKLRPELYDACEEFGILKYLWKNETTVPSIEKQSQNYWWLNANPKIWSFANMAIGEEQDYTLYNENGHKRRIFQNFLDAKEGDMVIGYESNPVKQVVGIATISKEQDGKSLYFRKVEGLSTPIDYQTLKACPELANMEYFVNPQGSLFKLTKDEYEFIMDVIREENPIEEKAKNEPYTKADFLEDVFMTENQYETLVAILKKKKNVILQGAPGVGKTYAATRLAYAMMGEKDDSRIELIQFHQNYSYEDFMMGYKPAGEGFELKYGVFYRFCQKAANQPKKDFFFIIDEINRGNMSKIFGELLMSIEKDYRNKLITLAYTGMPFSVPENLHIIGMMNTADRSLAMIDYALRRRFSFFAMEPGFDTKGFLKKQKAWDSDLLDALLEQVKKLNEQIASDKSLGKGFCIGHSYFCGLEDCSETELRAIVEYDILPMLSEYWFDEPTELQKWENRLLGVFKNDQR